MKATGLFIDLPHDKICTMPIWVDSAEGGQPTQIFRVSFQIATERKNWLSEDHVPANPTIVEVR